VHPPVGARVGEHERGLCATHLREKRLQVDGALGLGSGERGGGDHLRRFGGVVANEPFGGPAGERQPGRVGQARLDGRGGDALAQPLGVEGLLYQLRQVVQDGRLIGFALHVAGGGQVKDQRQQRREAVEDAEDARLEGKPVQRVAVGRERTAGRLHRETHREGHGHQHAHRKRRTGSFLPHRQVYDPGEAKGVDHHQRDGGAHGKHLERAGVATGRVPKGGQRRNAHQEQHQAPVALRSACAAVEGQPAQLQQEKKDERHFHQHQPVPLEHGPH